MTLFSHFGILNTFQRQEEQYLKKKHHWNDFSQVHNLKRKFNVP